VAPCFPVLPRSFLPWPSQGPGSFSCVQPATMDGLKVCLHPCPLWSLIENVLVSWLPFAQRARLTSISSCWWDGLAPSLPVDVAVNCFPLDRMIALLFFRDDRREFPKAWEHCWKRAFPPDGAFAPSSPLLRQESSLPISLLESDEDLSFMRRNVRMIVCRLFLIIPFDRVRVPFALRNPFPLF